MLLILNKSQSKEVNFVFICLIIFFSFSNISTKAEDKTENYSESYNAVFDILNKIYKLVLSLVV